MKYLFALFIAWFCTTSYASENVVSSSPENLEIVIYRAEPDDTSRLYEDTDPSDGLALIIETRTVDLPNGDLTIQFEGTAEAIVPQTAHIDGLPVRLDESNFNYDLISPANIISKSLGKQVRLVRTNAKTGQETEEKAILKSGPEGVLLDIDGHLEALGCSGLKEKIIFDEIPASLISKPSLSVHVNIEQAGKYQLKLSYLTRGLQWSADYIARFSNDGKTSDLQGWITLSNHLSTSFPNATVKVVAGNLTQSDETRPKQDAPTAEVETNCWPTDSFVDTHRGQGYVLKKAKNLIGPDEIIVTARRVEEVLMSELGDYKLYIIPYPTTIAANQTKQVRFTDLKKAEYERTYTYLIYPDPAVDHDEPEPAAITLRFENTQARGFGIPLPMGAIAAFDLDNAGQEIFIGDNKVGDIAINSPGEIFLGNAINVWVQQKIIDKREITHWWKKYRETDLEVELVNYKDVPIHFEALFRQELFPDMKVESESKTHINKNGYLAWNYDLSPGQQETLKLTIREPLKEKDR